jgi:hypothetical protein
MNRTRNKGAENKRGRGNSRSSRKLKQLLEQ